jgi:VWFA-related protein
MQIRQMARRSIAILLMILGISSLAAVASAQEQAQPIFRSSVAVVPITAVVRDSRNRIVADLELEDFQVLEQGVPRRIVDFNATVDGPVSVAFLFDTSGSMGLTSNLAKGKEVITQLVNRMHQSRDEAALYTFHRSLREEVSFTTDRGRVTRALSQVRPWGLTSLYDAIADTAKRLTMRSAVRRAVVVITDGVDTSSALSSREVAALASSVDVPIYVVAVVSPSDDPSHSQSRSIAPQAGALADVAQLTGGDVYYVTAFDPTVAIDRLMTAMRHQYFLAIESATAPGWYSLDVKTKRKGLTVRARRAYLSESADSPSR